MRISICIAIILIIRLNSLGQNQDSIDIYELYNQEKYKELTSKYESRIDKLPGGLVYRIAVAYYFDYDDKNCLRLIEIAKGKDSTMAGPYFTASRVYGYSDEYNKAIKSLKEAIKRNSTRPIYHSDIAKYYFHLDSLELALQYCQEALNMESTPKSAYGLLPLIYAGQGDTVNALKSGYAALEVLDTSHNQYARTLYNIAIFESLKSNYSNAQDLLLQLIEYDPKDYKAYSKLIQTYYGQGRGQEAQKYKDLLYAAKASNQLEGTISDQFCFDQFIHNGRRIMVFERYEDNKMEFYAKIKFYVLDENEKKDYTIQTENSPVNIELGANRYALAIDAGNMQGTYGFVPEDISYLKLKSYVIDILDKKLTLKSKTISK